VANRWYGAGFVCTKEVDLDQLVRAVRQRLGEAEGMDEAAEVPDGLPILDPDLRLGRDVVKGMDPLLVAAPFAGRAAWVVVPPVFDVHEPDPLPLLAAALHDAFPDAGTFVVSYHGSTGVERVIEADGELEDDGTDTPDGKTLLLANVARQLDVPLADLRAALDALDARPDVVKVALDETDAGRLRDAAARVVVAMGPGPRTLTVEPSAGLPEPPKPEPEPVVAAPPPQAKVEPDAARRAAEEATAKQMRMLFWIGAALLLLMIAFAVMAAFDTHGGR
jgi:hypothetical protein